MDLITFMSLMLQHHYELSIEELYDLKYSYDEGTKTTHNRLIEAGILN